MGKKSKARSKQPTQEDCDGVDSNRSCEDRHDMREEPEARLRLEMLIADLSLKFITDRKQAEQALAERLRFEQLLADLSAAFINQPPDRIDGIIDDSLKRLLEMLGHDRSSLAQFSEDRGHALVTHSCVVPGVEPSPVGVLADDHVPWIVEQVRNGKTVFLKCLPDDLPPEAEKERQLSMATGIKSNVAIPLKAGGLVLGFLAFSFLRQHREWPPDVVSRLQMIAEIFANALVRKRADEAIRATLAEIQQLRDRLEQENVYLREQIILKHRHGQIIGKSRALKKVLAEAERVAGTNTPVLLLGDHRGDQSGPGAGHAGRQVPCGSVSPVARFPDSRSATA